MSGESSRVAGVVLAAGAATRMGEPKVTLPYLDSTIVESVVSVASDAGLEPIVVVSGFYQESVAAVIGDTATVVHNPDASSGNLSSLDVGISAIGEVDAVVILLGDMPGIESQAVHRLVQQVMASGAAGGWVQYRGDEAGHPFVLSRRGLEVFSSLSGKRPVWRYLRGLHPDEVAVLHVDAVKPIDVNTPDDYRRLLAGSA